MKSILSFLGNMVPFIACFACIWLPLRLLTLRRPTTWGREAVLLLLHLSVVAILSQTLTPDGTHISLALTLTRDRSFYNFVPFRTLLRILRLRGGSDFTYFLLINVLGNVLIFAPVGFFVRLFRGCSVLRATLSGAALSLFIEIFQAFLPTRTTDVDDLILNTLGALLGAWLCGLVFRRRPETAEKYAGTKG